MSKRYHSGISGVFCRDHKTRRHGRKMDVYYIIRLKKNGKAVDEALGWASDGWTIEEAARYVGIIKKNMKSGIGPQSFKELQAEAQEERALLAAQRAEERRKKRITHLNFEEAAARFMEWARYNTKPKTHVGYEQHLRLHILPELGQMPLAEITTHEIMRLRAKLEKKKPTRGRGKTLAASTITGCLGVVREVFNYCIETEVSAQYPDTKLFTGENPVKHKKFGAAKILPKKDNRNLRVLYDDEVDAILHASHACSNDQYHITMIALHTGMREQEIVSLQREHLTAIDRRIIHILDSKSGTRTVSFPPVLDEIMHMRKDATRNWLFSGNGVNGHRTAASVSRQFTRIADAIGLNTGINDNRLRATFHTLRSTYAVRMLVGGMDLENLRLQLGHRDIGTTSKNYLPLVESFRVESVARAHQNGFIKRLDK
ncbi:site-specific integrase [Halodesulfovibrio sp.]|uniref:tyrosine-type recombinase/integrase n=1 Tax=Halodesulfovibrio sp. TaxID=1912772 RepID=UPI0025B7C23B|nr:site-specific integrase [Halodesulfovibrio sp.]